MTAPTPEDDDTRRANDSRALIELGAARAELHEAQRIVALLEADRATGSPVAVARDVIEWDLAARRVEAWTHVVNRLRDEARRRGLFPA